MAEAPLDDILKIEELSVSFYTPRGEIEAVRNVSLRVHRAEILAIVGESGSGKSVLCKSIMKMLPDIAGIRSGRIIAEGRDITSFSEKEMRKLRGSFFSMVFQNPMTVMDPTYSVGAQIAEALRVHDKMMTKAAAFDEAIRLMSLTGIEHADKRARMYPGELSGGMRQRAVIAMALAARPKLIFADEPTTALDERIRWEILELFKEIRDKLGTSIVLVSHDLNAVRRVADRVCVMYAGKIIETGSTEEIFMCPGHPYTRALLKAMPDNTDRSELLYDIPGMPPMLIAPPKGDAFAARNIHALKIDFIREAPMFRMSDTHYAASWELADEETKAKEPELFEEAAADNDRGGSFEASLVAKPHTEKNFENDIILAVRDLSCTYMADRHTAVRAIDGLSFEVKRGEIFGIVGESGSGKSTLAKCIMNILKPDSGSIIYKGIDIWDRKAFTANKKMLNTSRQLIFQDSDSALDPRMKTADIIAEPMRIARITPEYGSVREAAIRIMEAVGLDQSYADKYPSDMSGGQRQRAAIARALSMKPELIIADEALASLDVSVQAQIVNLFRKLQREYGFTLLFISHDKSMVRYLCDRAAVLDHGRLTEIVNGESFA